jgi:hypothetical protein
MRWWKGEVHLEVKAFRYVLFFNERVICHHLHLQGLRLLARSAVKYQATFFLAFLDHVFPLADNPEAAWELFPMASSVDVPANFSYFRAFAFKFPHA